MCPELWLVPGDSRSDRREADGVRVVLADDHPLSLFAMRRVLESDRGIEIVGEAEALKPAISVTLRVRPDVLVLAVWMPRSRIGTVEMLAGTLGGTAIILATMERDAAFASRALAVGARGYVLKDRADSDLPHAIHAVARGQRYVSPTAGVTPLP